MRNVHERDFIKQDLVRAAKSLSPEGFADLDDGFANFAEHAGAAQTSSADTEAEDEHLSEDEIESLRSEAIAELKSYISGVDVSADVPEDGAYAILDAKTGALSYRYGSDAGKPRGTGYFDFSVSTSTADEFVVGFAHSHPLVTSAKSRDPRRDNKRNLSLNRDDRRAMLGFTSDIDPTGLGSVAILKNWRGDIICERPDGGRC